MTDQLTNALRDLDVVRTTHETLSRQRDEIRREKHDQIQARANRWTSIILTVQNNKPHWEKAIPWCHYIEHNDGGDRWAIGMGFEVSRLESPSQWYWEGKVQGDVLESPTARWEEFMTMLEETAVKILEKWAETWKVGVNHLKHDIASLNELE